MGAVAIIAAFVVLYNFLINLQKVCRLERWKRQYDESVKLTNNDRRVRENRKACEDLFREAGVWRTSANANIMFVEAIGVYKRKMIDSIDPLVWIRVVLFLPRYVMDYVGVKRKEKTSRIICVLWWAFEILCTVFLEKVFERIAEQIIG